MPGLSNQILKCHASLKRFNIIPPEPCNHNDFDTRVIQHATCCREETDATQWDAINFVRIGVDE